MAFRRIATDSFVLRAGSFEQLQPVIRLDLVDDRLDERIHFGTFGVVGRADVAYAIVADQPVQFAPGVSDLGVIDGDRMSAGVLHQPHAGDVGRTVAHVDHAPEGYRALVLLDVLVHELAVEDRFDALVDLEDELSLVGVIDRYGGPIGDSVDVVQERAGVDPPEFMGDLRAFDDLLQARGVDVVQDADAPRRAVGVDACEPLPDSFVEGRRGGPTPGTLRVAGTGLSTAPPGSCGPCRSAPCRRPAPRPVGWRRARTPCCSCRRRG